MKSYKISMRKIDSFKSISNVLAQFKKQTEDIQGFRESVDELNKKIKKLDHLQIIAAKDASLTEEVKNKYRSELIDKALQIITILKIHAYDKKKAKLRKLLEKFSSEEFHKSSDSKLIKLLQKTWQVIRKLEGYSVAFSDKLNLKKIAKNTEVVSRLEKQFGISTLLINDLEEAYISFINAFYDYENELTEKIEVIIKIKKNIGDTEKLVGKKIDLYFSIF